MQASFRPPAVLHPLSVLLQLIELFKGKGADAKRSSWCIKPWQKWDWTQSEDPARCQFFSHKVSKSRTIFSLDHMLKMCVSNAFVINLFVVLCFLLICSWYDISGWSTKKRQPVLFPKPTVEKGWNQNPIQQLGLHFTICKKNKNYNHNASHLSNSVERIPSFVSFFCWSMIV